MAAAAAAKAAAAALSAGAAFAASSGRAHAGLIPGWSSPSPAPAPAAGAPPVPAPAAGEEPPPPPKVRNDNPRTSAAGLDPAPLERAVELLQYMESLKNPTEIKKVGLPRFGGTFARRLLPVPWF
jgi:ATPase family AAA domain-containing protein 3A/B